MATLTREEREYQILLSRRLGPIFPLYGILEPSPGVLKCECGRPSCESPGKHPRPGYKRKATTDPNVIRKWLNRLPHANYGVVTGELTIGVDADVRDGENGM